MIMPLRSSASSAVKSFILALLPFFTFSFLLLTCVPAHADAFDIHFNEILIDPAGTDTGNERIELKNKGATAQDLTGMCICTAAACGGTAYCFPAGITLPSGSYLVLHVNQTGTNSSTDAYTGPFTDLNNAQDNVALYLDNTDFTLDDNLVDFVQWGAGNQARASVAESAAVWTAAEFITTVAEGHSIEAKDWKAYRPQDWFNQWTPSLGAANWLHNHPTAKVGADQAVFEGAAVTLDGSTSSDPEGVAVTYAWTQTAGPAVTLSGPSSAKPTFTAPDVGEQQTLTFQLVVSDGALSSPAVTATVTVKDSGSLTVAKTPFSPGDSSEKRGVENLPMLQFSLTAGPNENVKVVSIEVTASGTGDDRRSVGAVEGWLDSNGNGRVDGDDKVILSSKTFSADDGKLSWTGLNQTVAAGTTSTWLLTYDLVGSPVFGDTFSLAIPAGGLVATGVTTGRSSPVNGLPLSGPTKTISDKPSLVVSLGPVENGDVKVPPGTKDIAMLPLVLSAGSVENVVVQSLKLTDNRVAAKTSLVEAVNLFLDSNANGLLDPEEQALADPSTYPEDDEQLTFTISSLTVPASGSVSLLVTYDLAADMLHGETFIAEIEQAADVVVVGSQSGAAADVSGPPVKGPEIQVENVGSLTVSGLHLPRPVEPIAFPGSMTALGLRLEASNAEDLLLTTLRLHDFFGPVEGLLSGADLYNDVNLNGRLDRDDVRLAAALIDFGGNEARFEGMRVALAPGESKQWLAVLRFGVDDALAGHIHPGWYAVAGALALLALFFARTRILPPRKSVLSEDSHRDHRGHREKTTSEMRFVSLCSLWLNGVSFSALRTLRLCASAVRFFAFVLCLFTLTTCGSEGETSDAGGPADGGVLEGPQVIEMSLKWNGASDIIAMGERSRVKVPVQARMVQGPEFKILVENP